LEDRDQVLRPEHGVIGLLDLKFQIKLIEEQLALCDFELPLRLDEGGGGGLH